MTDQAVRVLLVEDNPGDARLIQEHLADANMDEFEMVHVNSLAKALPHLMERRIDVILLDLSLPDGQGLETLTRMHDDAPDVPIVVLTGLNDEAMAVRAVQEGAQDYLVKEQVGGTLLVRSMRYAIQRHRLMAELRALSLVDELTGLYNRRGFLMLAGQQIKLAHRMKKPLLLIFADLDNLKSINDNWGHQEGDQALMETARQLKQTLRESDIIARMGGDEFAVLAVNTLERNAAESLRSRVEQKLEEFNRQSDRPYRLSVSLGVALYDPEKPRVVEALLDEADQHMYEQKQERNSRC